MAGRLDHETRQRIRRAISDTRRARARNAHRIEKELENEMTITAQIMCACAHPFRQHAFGGGCTLAGCHCQKFDLDEVGNGNGHQEDGRDALERMRGEQQAASDSSSSTETAKPEAARPKTKAAPADRPCKRCGKPQRQPAVTVGPYSYLCEEHYAEMRATMSRAQYDANAKRGRGRERAAETESPSLETGSRPDTPPPAPALRAPESAPPPAVLEQPAAMRITTLEIELGPWRLHRNDDGICSLALGIESLPDLPWEQVQQLPALIAAIGQAFGAADE